MLCQHVKITYPQNYCQIRVTRAVAVSPTVVGSYNLYLQLCLPANFAAQELDLELPPKI